MKINEGDAAAISMQFASNADRLDAIRRVHVTSIAIS